MSKAITSLRARVLHLAQSEIYKYYPLNDICELLFMKLSAGAAIETPFNNIARAYTELFNKPCRIVPIRRKNIIDGLQVCFDDRHLHHREDYSAIRAAAMKNNGFVLLSREEVVRIRKLEDAIALRRYHVWQNSMIRFAKDEGYMLTIEALNEEERKNVIIGYSFHFHKKAQTPKS